MSDRPTFSLPDGLSLDVTNDTIDLKFDGDVTLATSLGRRFGSIEVGGDLTVTFAGPLTGNVRCGGTLTVAGDIDADHVHARVVSLGRNNVKCKALSADEKITLGAATIVADVVIAPEIAMDPKAQGRVTVIESTNERGATKIKGGFGLADYEDMFGNSDEFLSSRGLRRLDHGGGPLADGVASAPASKPSPTAAPKTEPKSTAPRAAPPEPKVERKAAPPSKAPDKKPADEDTEDPVSVSFDDLEPVAEQVESAAKSSGDIHQRLVDALGRITACYEGTDLPPAVNELQDLVKSKDYDALRQNITEVWNGLLGFHQKRGIRPHHQVTHAFNVINNLVQQ